MSLWLFNVYMCAMNEVKMGMQKISAISGVGEREWKLLGFLHIDIFVLCGESEEDLNVMVGHFVEVYRSLKVNAD